MEIKRIVRQYFFLLVLASCIAAFLCGVTSVREKTDYNMKMTLYDKIQIEKNDEGVILVFGDSESFFLPDYAGDFLSKVKKSFDESINYLF